MKIALVARHATPPTHTADPYSADQSAHLDGLGRALAAQGHDVVIYARKDSPTLPGRKRIAPRLTAEYIEAGPQAPVPPDELPQYAKDLASHLARRWRKNRPDVVHAFHWTNGLAALGAARECPVPVVVTFGSLGIAEHAHRIAGENSATRTKMESCIARSAAGVVATTSDEVADLARLGVPNARVGVVPFGVDAEIFKPEGLIAKHKKLTRLLAVGPLAEYRGLDKLLRCLADLPNTELVIAGGPAADDLEADHGYRILAKLAAHLGVADRVQFTGHVSDRELPALLRSADLLVSAARYEPHAMTAIRAMACGVPVVAPAIGIYKDAVIDGTTGTLVPPNRPELLARRLRDLLASPMRIAAYGIAAVDRAKSRYPWERVASESVKAYERVIDRAARQEPAASQLTPAQRPARTLAPAAATQAATPAADHADDQAACRPMPRMTATRQVARKRQALVAAAHNAA